MTQSERQILVEIWLLTFEPKHNVVLTLYERFVPIGIGLNDQKNSNSKPTLRIAAEECNQAVSNNLNLE